MTPERRAAAVVMLAKVCADLEQDVAALDGQQFTGRNVAVAIGNLAAQVDALARVLLAMLEHPPGT